MKVFRTIISISLCSLLLIFSSVNIYAAEKNVPKGMDFGVNAKKTKHQRSDKTFFDVDLKKGQTENFQLKIENTSNQPITIEVTPVDATTNSSGEIQYHGKNEFKKSFKHRFTDITSEKQVVSIDGKANKTVEFHCQIPDEITEGEILGGFNISQIDFDQQPTNTKNSNIEIKNRYTYTVAAFIHLDNSGKLNDIFDLGKIELKKVNTFRKLQIDFENVIPQLQNKVKLDVNIKKKGSKKAIISESFDDVQLAPLSVFPIQLSGQNILAGKYEAIISVTHNKKQTTLNKEFVISNENSQATKDEHNNYMTLFQILFGSIVVIILIIGMCVVYLYKFKTSR